MASLLAPQLLRELSKTSDRPAEKRSSLLSQSEAKLSKTENTSERVSLLTQHERKTSFGSSLAARGSTEPTTRRSGSLQEDDRRSNLFNIAGDSETRIPSISERKTSLLSENNRKNSLLSQSERKISLGATTENQRSGLISESKKLLGLDSENSDKKESFRDRVNEYSKKWDREDKENVSLEESKGYWNNNTEQATRKTSKESDDFRANSTSRRSSQDDRRTSRDDRRTSHDNRKTSQDNRKSSLDDRRTSLDDRRTSFDDRRSSQLRDRSNSLGRSAKTENPDRQLAIRPDYPVYQKEDFEKNMKIDDSKHFLSLSHFNQHSEPPLNEIISIEEQLELELKQRNEEDQLYRQYLADRKAQENNVMHMQEEEREELFALMNKKERSRMINMVNKHAQQMMDLIYRAKVRYLTEAEESMEQIAARYPKDPPEIRPPEYLKAQVYENNDDVFETVDQTAKTAANTKFESFTELVRYLVGRFSSDVDKARALFRYMTEVEFEHSSWFLYYPSKENTRGAPTNLFRSVEFGIESKALTYKRLCAYAGLHAITIQGFCKTKEYEPGEEFVDNRWRNSWNAVYVSGGWRLVQPNWAALHVNTKALREKRVMYQDHYFLADPDKFIFEFFPLSAEYQFLEHPITRSEFESLPVLRSTFFHFDLSLARNEGLLTAVINADDNGEANIYLNSPNNVCYHYCLTTCRQGSKPGSSSFKVKGGKVPLDRFVMMSVQEGECIFNVHLPNTGEYILEIGAAFYPPLNELLSAPLSYINVCKFKIVCNKLAKAMVPLPNCAPGEWGPNKAFKLFGLKGVSHPRPTIYAAPPSDIDLTEVRPLTLNIEFEKTEPVLDFVVKLCKNDGDKKMLKQGARYRNKEKYVIFDIKVPQDGQYGLDIYTRRSWEDKLLHCCKYLINCDV